MATPRPVPLYLRAVADEIWEDSWNSFIRLPSCHCAKRTRRGVQRSKVRTQHIGGSSRRACRKPSVHSSLPKHFGSRPSLRPRRPAPEALARRCARPRSAGPQKVPSRESWQTLVSVWAYRSFSGEVEASNTPTIRALSPHAVTNFRA
jgi:hypothetical protein